MRTPEQHRQVEDRRVQEQNRLMGGRLGQERCRLLQGRDRLEQGGLRQEQDTLVQEQDRLVQVRDTQVPEPHKQASRARGLRKGVGDSRSRTTW